MPVGDGALAKHHLALVGAVLCPEAVAAIVHGLGAGVHGRGGRPTNQATAGQVPVVEQEAFLLLSIVREKVAILLDLTHLLAQGVGLRDVGDGIGFHQLVLGRVTAPDGEVLAGPGAEAGAGAGAQTLAVHRKQQG